MPRGWVETREAADNRHDEICYQFRTLMLHIICRRKRSVFARHKTQIILPLIRGYWRGLLRIVGGVHTARSWCVWTSSIYREDQLPRAKFVNIA